MEEQRDVQPQIFSLEHAILTAFFLGLLIVCTVFGNGLVVAAIVLDKNLRRVSNLLILSLAATDIAVACLVMPVSVINEVTNGWIFSSELCDLWISLDVLCCTASILHLVAIAIDRYFAVTNVNYIQTRSARKILLVIVLVWFIGFCVSIPPTFGWKEPDDSLNVTGECIISQDLGYTIFSTLCAFYLPAIAMLLVYSKIYLIARERIRKRKFWQMSMKKSRSDAIALSTAQTTQGSSKKTEMVSEAVGEAPEPSVDISSEDFDTVDDYKDNFADYESTDDDLDENIQESSTVDHVANNTTHTETMEERETKWQHRIKEINTRKKLQRRREKKAARTLTIITGTFFICWTPFFINALTGPFVSDNFVMPPLATSFLLWLGYCNSLMNPIIYTIFNQEFRLAFRKILFGKCYGKCTR